MKDFNRLHALPLRQLDDNPRVCIITAWNEKYSKLAEIAIPNFVAYGQKHGYAVRGYPGEYHEDPSRPETYGDKVKHSLYYDVAGHCDIVMWVDIDSLFVNLEIRIEDKIGFGKFWYTFDINGPCSGIWIAKTDEITESHLRYAYEHAAIESHVRHGKIEPNGISDQDMMTRLMNVPPFDETFGPCHDAERAGHHYDKIVENTWVVTFPGVPVETKLAKMREYSELI